MGRRDEILEAALGLVQREGLGALSVRGVAGAAGVGATTLRHYFPSQTDLYQSVAARLVSGSLEDLEIGDDALDPASRLSDCLLQFLPQPGQQDPALTAWFELYRLAIGPEPIPAVRGIVESAHRSAAVSLHRWLTVLADQGHVTHLDIDVNAIRALALIDGLHLSLLLDPARVELDFAHDALRWFAKHVVAH